MTGLNFKNDLVTLNLGLCQSDNAGNFLQGAKSYMYQYTPDPVTESSAWQSMPGTVHKTVFTGLEGGKKYWCHLLALGINGQSVYSDPVSRVAQ